MTEESCWDEPESIWDIRRKAPLHFLAKADNARMSAYVLSHIDKHSAENFASEFGYGGTPGIALGEGFRREASIAVELILKAILCIKNQAPPPAIHDVYNLWSKADLPVLSDDDSIRLVLMTQILYWSGRYAAPISDRHFELSMARLEKHQKGNHSGGLKFVKSVSFEWVDFEKIYQVAHHYFWKLAD